MSEVKSRAECTSGFSRKSAGAPDARTSPRSSVCSATAPIGSASPRTATTGTATPWRRSTKSWARRDGDSNCKASHGRCASSPGDGSPNAADGMTLPATRSTRRGMPRATRVRSCLGCLSFGEASRRASKRRRTAGLLAPALRLRNSTLRDSRPECKRGATNTDPAPPRPRPEASPQRARPDDQAQHHRGQAQARQRPSLRKLRITKWQDRSSPRGGLW